MHVYIYYMFRSTWNTIKMIASLDRVSTLYTACSLIYFQIAGFVGLYWYATFTTSSELFFSGFINCWCCAQHLNVLTMAGSKSHSLLTIHHLIGAFTYHRGWYVHEHINHADLGDEGIFQHHPLNEIKRVQLSMWYRGYFIFASRPFPTLFGRLAVL